MRPIHRRRVLQGLGAAALGAFLPSSSRAGSSPVSSEETLAGFRRWVGELYTWHCASFFDLEAALTPLEREYVRRCIDLCPLWGAHDIDDNFAYSLFTLSHRVRGDQVNSARAAFGSVTYARELRPMMSEILAARGLELSALPHADRAAGVGWDFGTGDVKVYMLLDNWAQVRDPDLLMLLRRVEHRPKHDVGLVSFTSRGGKLVERKVYVALEEDTRRAQESLGVERALHTNLMITDRRGVVEQIDLADPRSLQRINDTGNALIAGYHRRFNTGVDTITYVDRDNYTLYFPG